MALPKFLQPCLASYDLSQLDIKRDHELIITEVLNKGNYRDLRWLGQTYTQDEIKSVVASPMRGMWLRSVLVYWLRIFDLKIPEAVLRKAIINLAP